MSAEEREYSHGDRCIKITEYLCVYGKLRAKDAASLVGCSRSTAYYILNKICRVTLTCKEGEYYVYYMDGSKI